MNRSTPWAVFVVLATACLLPNAALHAQGITYPRTLYIAYPSTPLYDSAHHMAPIRDRLQIGDSVLALGTVGKYFLVQHQGRHVYVMGANVTLAPPRRRARQAKAVVGSTVAISSKADSSTTDSSVANSVQRNARGPAPGNTSADSAGRRSVAGLPASYPATTDARARRARPRAADSTRPARPSVRPFGQCLATTRSGRRCSRAAADTMGYCWQHRKR